MQLLARRLKFIKPWGWGFLNLFIKKPWRLNQLHENYLLLLNLVLNSVTKDIVYKRNISLILSFMIKS